MVWCKKMAGLSQLQLSECLKYLEVSELVVTKTRSKGTYGEVQEVKVREMK